MRVLLATHASLEVDSGEERALLDLGGHLLALGHEVRFANYEGLLDNEPRRTLAQVCEQLGAAQLVPIPAMPLLGRFWAIPGIRGLKALAQSVRWADVVVFGQFYGFDVTMYLVGKALRRPLVCSQANALFRRYRFTVRDAVQEAYERTIGIALLRRFDGVRVCNSDDLRSLTERGCRRVVLLYPPNTDLSVMGRSQDLPDSYRTIVQQVTTDSRFKLLVAGRMTHQKGLDLLAQALFRLGEEHAETLNRLVLLFAGTKRLPVELNGVAARYPRLVVNLGILPRDAFPSIMDSVDAVLVPSRYESFGRVAAEAQSLGKPVVGTNITGLREVVTNGVTGILVDSWSADALAAAIRELHDVYVSHPERWSAMKAAARGSFEEQFGPARVRGQMEALTAALEELAAHRSS
jgi:glycosyltransferase involved in cell wall biosynthesis